MEGKDCLKIVLLCCLWYTISSANNIIGKIVLNYFPYPLTVSMVQLLSITIYSQPTLYILGIRSCLKFSRKYMWTYILPLAAGKFLAVLFSHISVWKVPLSYAHTVKATMPLFTVFFGRLFLDQTHSSVVYVSLVPIVAGVALSSLTEISFDAFGLISALTSTAMFALMQLFSKKVMSDTGIHHFRLLHLLTQLALALLMPVWLCVDLPRLLFRSHDVWRSRAVETLGLLCVDGALSWLQNMVAFTVLHLVSPLTYSVCNATKRVAIVSASLFLLHNPVTAANVAGMGLALGGVFLYNRAKYAEMRQIPVFAGSDKTPLLPTTVTAARANRNQLFDSCTPVVIDWADKLRPVYGASHLMTSSNSAARAERLQPVAVLVS